MPRCYYCKQDLPESEFYVTEAKSRGISDACRSCNRLMSKANYQRRKEYHKEQSRQWQKDNPETYKQILGRNRDKRRAAERSAEYDKTVYLEAVAERDNDICQICGQTCSVEDRSIDHKIPLTRGGNHTWENVQLAHRRCNARKNDRTPEEFEEYVRWATDQEQAANKRK